MADIKWYPFVEINIDHRIDIKDIATIASDLLVSVGECIEDCFS